jgi:hypothetical protein
MTNLRWKLALKFLLVCSIAGCGGQVLLGDNGDADASDAQQGGDTSSLGPADGGVTTLPDGATVVQDGITGTWTGYVESYHFASGSDGLTLALVSDGKGNVAGTIAFGGGPPPPVATNPDVAEPPASDTYGTRPLPVVEALPFVLRNVTVSAARLQFGVTSRDAWKHFCEIQTKTYLASDGSYSCLPGVSAVTGPTCTLNTVGTPTPVDCGKLELCSSDVCSCTATGCTESSHSPIDVDFDVALSNGTASGSTTGRLGDKNVHLTRTQ